MTDTLEQPTPIEPVSRRSRRVRTVVAGLLLVLITAGTLFGSDDDFPFGPLRMYSTRDDPNGQISQAVVQAYSRDGRSFDVTDTAGAPRRAELEGRFGEFTSDPRRFDVIGPQYLTSGAQLRGHPGVTVAEVRLVRRLYQLHDGRRDGPAVDQVVARWVVPR